MIIIGFNLVIESSYSMDAHGNGVPNCTVDQGHVQPREHGDVVVLERQHDVGLVPARLVLHHSKYSTHVCMHGISRISHLKQGKFKLVQFLYLVSLCPSNGTEFWC